MYFNKMSYIFDISVWGARLLFLRTIFLHKRQNPEIEVDPFSLAVLTQKNFYRVLSGFPIVYTLKHIINFLLIIKLLLNEFE